MTAQKTTIDWPSIKALSFDCYGTLIDWERGILAALGEWATEFGADRLLAGFSAIEPSVEHAHPTWPYRQVMSEVYHQMAESLGVVVDRHAAFGFSASIGGWPPFPDTVDALRRLARRFRLYILSNVDEVSIAGTLGQLEVDFAGVYTAEQIGSYKPDRRNFDYLLARVHEHGVVPSELVHVAQSLFHDHAPAQALGLKTVWIDRSAGRQGATKLPDPLPRFDARHETLGAFADAISL